MEDEQKENKRRKLLRSIAAGSGAVIAGRSLPDSWSRPVVDSVMLPAHAQTSGAFTGTTRGLVQLQEDSTRLASLMNAFVNEARAGANFSTMDVSYCVVLNEAGTAGDVDIIMTFYDFNVRNNCTSNYLFQLSSVPVGGAPVDLYSGTVQSGCNLNPASLEMGAGDLLARMGLVPDAHAGKGGIPDHIQLTGANGTVTGVLYLFDGATIDIFTLGIGTCETYVPMCSGVCYE